MGGQMTGLKRMKETSKPEADYTHRPDRDRPTSRKCMCCNQVFESEGWHNRLCSRCRSRS